MSTTTMPAQKQDHQPGVESKMRPEPDYEPKCPGVGKLKDKVALITRRRQRDRTCRRGRHGARGREDRDRLSRGTQGRQQDKRTGET
jgi:hypothetical protein